MKSVEGGKKVKEAQYLMAIKPEPKDNAKGNKRARADSAEDDKPSQVSNGDNKQELPPRNKRMAKRRSLDPSKFLWMRVARLVVSTVGTETVAYLPWILLTNLAASAQVYIDDSSIIYDAALNQTNVGNNNNKFYRIQVTPIPCCGGPRS